jgi:hypothetical protein
LPKADRCLIWFVGLVVLSSCGDGARSDTERDSKLADNTSSEPFDGSSEGPCTLIQDVNDLIAIQNNRSGCFVLTKDIDLAGIDWTAHATQLGNVETPFLGSIDGQGFKIKNVKSDYSFIRFVRGATFKNIVFESPRIGQNGAPAPADGAFTPAIADFDGNYAKGLIQQAYQSESNQPTRFENVHVTDGKIFGFHTVTNELTTGSSQQSLGNAGAFVGCGWHLEIKNSTANVTFVSPRPGIERVGGFVGRLKNYFFSQGGYFTYLPVERPLNIIENSKARVRFDYNPTSNWSGNVWEVAEIGGLIGSADLFYQQVMQLTTNAAIELRRVEADLQFKSPITSQAAGSYPALAFVGGLIGQMWGGRNVESDPAPCRTVIEQAAIKFNFEVHHPRVSDVSGLMHDRPYNGGNSCQRMIRDVSASGALVNQVQSNNWRMAGIVTVGGSQSGVSPINLDRVLSSFVISVPASAAAKVRPVYYSDSASPIPQVSATFYNSSSIPSGISQDSYASAKTANQMQSASTWMDAGYPASIWNVQNGSIPTLKGISVVAPPAP